jgi:glycosyltransferase involved in cell wall biosynthesis
MSINISIIIPVYNRELLIVDTLHSVERQSYNYWECIVIDDDSTDDTESVVNTFCERDLRFKFCKRPETKPKGANACRNYGLELSQGDYVVFLDSDDLLQPMCLEKRVSYLQRNPVDMLLSHTAIFDFKINDSEFIWNKLDIAGSHEGYLLRFLKKDIPWSTTGVTWSKDFLNKIGGWDQRLYAWQDWELHVRALFNYPLIAILKGKPDSYWRREGDVSKISNTYKHADYIDSMFLTVVLFNNYLMRSKINSSQLLTAYKKFVYARLIKSTIERGYINVSLQALFIQPFFKGITRFSFIKRLFIQFFCNRKKLRFLNTKQIYQRQQEYLSESNTFIKHTIRDI